MKEKRWRCLEFVNANSIGMECDRASVGYMPGNFRFIRINGRGRRIWTIFLPRPYCTNAWLKITVMRYFMCNKPFKNRRAGEHTLSRLTHRAVGFVLCLNSSRLKCCFGGWTNRLVYDPVSRKSLGNAENGCSKRNNDFFSFYTLNGMSGTLCSELPNSSMGTFRWAY